MSDKKLQNSGEELFRQAFSDIAPLKQDKVPPHRQPITGKKSSKSTRIQHKQAAASFYFSDSFEAHFSEVGPLKYVKPGADSYEIKKLRRGEYVPDLILDLHGLKKEDVKLEIAALIQAAQKQHIDCVCIVHGIGNYVLKKAVPNYLVQHPAITGFHQAPLEWGGNGALLALIERE